MKRGQRRSYLQPWLFGIIAGCIVVFAEVFLRIYPPSAYAFCLSCHTRDLVNTIINVAWEGNYQTAVIAQRLFMITSPGVFLGAFMAARMFNEQHVQRSGHPFGFFLTGFVVMIIGLLIFGCPTRLLIRVGYGEFYGIVAILGMFLGIWCGTVMMRFHWNGKSS
jgi:hypothetical protein